MAFDLASARPVESSGFDLSTAKPVADVQDVQEEEQKSVRDQINEAILSTDAGKTVSEFGAALGRGTTDIVDFFTTKPVNAALELSGVDAEVPTLTESLSPATEGNFMEDGLAKDAVRSAGELVPAAVTGGAVIKTAASTLPKIGQASESVAKGVLRQVGNVSLKTEAAAGALSGAGAEGGGELGEELGGATGRVIGEQAGGLLAPLSASVVKNTGKSFVTSGAKKLLKESAPTIEGLKETARKVYKHIDDLGAVVDTRRVGRLSKQLHESVVKEGFDTDLHPKVSVALKRFAETDGKDLSLSEIDILRKKARNAVSSLDPDEQRLGKILVNKIDDFLDNLKPKDFKRGASNEVGYLYKDARQLWSRAKKAELLEEAFTKANLQASGFENGIRVQLRSILNNKKKRAGFTTEEIKVMQQVVKGGGLENTAKMLGRLGFSEGQASNMLLGSLGVAGGAAVAGTGGAVAIPLIGQVSRKLAQKLTKNNAEFTDAVVRAGKNGTRLVNEYMRAVPRKDRSAKELAELLMRPDIGLSQVKAKIASTPKEQRQIIANAVFYAEALREQKVKDSDQ